MQGVKSYPRSYVEACRAGIADRIADYRDIAAAADLDDVYAFEPTFFNDLVVVLDTMFVHRLPSQEGTDGNPLNEVRILVESLLQNGGLLAESVAIEQDPKASVLGLRIGEEIRVREEGFARLAEAFFDEIERRFGDD